MYSAVVASFLACHVFDAQEAARGSVSAPPAARDADDKKKIIAIHEKQSP